MKEMQFSLSTINHCLDVLRHMRWRKFSKNHWDDKGQVFVLFGVKK